MRILILLLVAAALAGCSDEGGDSEAVNEHGGHGESEYGGDTSLITEKPDWQVGQYWSYVDQAGTEFDLVVAADEGSSWLMLNSDLGNAVFDWYNDVSFLGSIQKSDLSGKQGSDKVQFLDFPLEHSKDWTTSWDGENRHARAHANTGNTWHISIHAGGTDSNQFFAEMIYDPATGWFDAMTFYGDDGEAQYVLTSTGAGTGYAGSVHRYTAIEGAGSYDQTGPGAQQATFTMDEEQELVIDYVRDCGSMPGQILVGLMPPAEDGSAQVLPPAPFVNEPVWGDTIACPGGGAENGTDVIPGQPGTWRFDGLVGNGDGSFDVELTTRAYETFTF